MTKNCAELAAGMAVAGVTAAGIIQTHDRPGSDARRID